MPDLRFRRLFLAAAALSLAACGPRRPPPEVEPPDTARQPVNYFVRVSRPATGAYDLSLTTDRVRRDSLDFVLPSWAPGQYGPLSSQVQLESFSVRDGHGDPIATRRISGTRWRLYPDGEQYLNVAYQVLPDPASEPLPFRTRLDLHAGYALGAGLFGFFEGLENRPVRISFDLPTGWRASAPLQSEGPERFSAASYVELPGTPFVIGDRYRDYKLFQRGRPHQVIVQGVGADFVPDSLLALVDEVIRIGTDFYGGPDYERYLFAVHFVPPDATGIGGMGAAEGAAIFLPEMDAARVRDAGMESILLHQYLHAWFPGSFGPTTLIRPDWSSAPRAPELWLVEGVAEYYARLLPVRRTGGTSRARFYDAMGTLITVWRELGGGDRIEPAGLVGPVVRGGEEGAMPRLVAGGAIATFLLDLEIRGQSRGARGLDELLYFLQRSTAIGVGYDDGIWLRAEEALALSPGTLEAVRSSAGVSLDVGLSRAGLRAVERSERRRSLGARLQVRPGGGFLVASVDPGGTAESAGLRQGDRILEINDTPIGPSEVVATRYALDTYIASARPGAPIRFSIERDGEEHEARGQVRESRVRHVEIVELADASPEALLVRASLFEPAQPVPGGR